METDISAKVLTMPESHPYRSSEIDKIMQALSKARGLYKPLKPNEDCPGGKFANIMAIFEATRIALAENELAFYQYIELLDQGSGAALLKSVLGHSSGQFIMSCARIVAGTTDRQTGNTYEIHKRFHALMLLGIAPSEHDPMAFDDGGQEQDEDNLVKRLKKPQSEKKIDRTDVIAKDQYNELLIELDSYPEIVENILEVYNIETLADLPKEEYHPAMRKIHKIKRTLDDYKNKKQ